MTVHPNRAIFLPRTNLPTFGEFRESPTRPQTRIPDPGTAQVKCFLRIWGGGGGGVEVAKSVGPSLSVPSPQCSLAGSVRCLRRDQVHN